MTTAKRLELSARARRDFADIWTYSADEWGQAQAQRYTDALHDAMTALANGGRIGQRASAPGFLRLKVNSHWIYYRERRTVIGVVRILHPSQNAERHLSRAR